MYGTLVLILAKTENFCGWSQDILLLKGTKHQLSLLDKMPWYRGSFMPVLHFSSDHALLQREGLTKYNKQAAYHHHTNKYT